VRWLVCVGGPEREREMYELDLDCSLGSFVSVCVLALEEASFLPCASTRGLSSDVA